MAGQVIVSTLASSNGTTGALQLDYLKYGNVAVQTVVNTTGAGLTYNVEYSMDSVASASQINWFSSNSSNNSSNALFSFTFPN
jgi:hypothetical protein